MNENFITLSIHRTLKEKIEQLAKDTNRSVAGMVKEMYDEYVRNHQ